MYLKERLQKLPIGDFIEVGPGSGEISNLLLSLGWKGSAYDLEFDTIQRLESRFSHQIDGGKYKAVNCDFLSLDPNITPKGDLIISSMVMEHLNEDLENRYMQQAKMLLKPNGLFVGLVPSSPKYWGIEDEIAGHHRRYTFDSIQKLTHDTNWHLSHCVGLTFPISNLLFPLSNFLVEKKESHKISLSNLQKTKASGKRNVKYKTHFPSIFSIFLNSYFLFPFHLLQKIFLYSDSAMVIFFEAKP